MMPNLANLRSPFLFNCWVSVDFDCFSDLPAAFMLDGCDELAVDPINLVVFFLCMFDDC